MRKPAWWAIACAVPLLLIAAYTLPYQFLSAAVDGLLELFIDPYGSSFAVVSAAVPLLVAIAIFAPITLWAVRWLARRGAPREVGWIVFGVALVVAAGLMVLESTPWVFSWTGLAVALGAAASLWMSRRSVPSRPGPRLPKWCMATLRKLGILVGAFGLIGIGSLVLFDLLLPDERAPFDISNPRYAPDGRGVYYVMTYDTGEDSWEEELQYVPFVGAKAEVVSLESLPPVLAVEMSKLMDYEASIPASMGSEWTLAISPDGTLRVGPDLNQSRSDSPKLLLTDVESGATRLAASWDSGLLNAAVWLDDHTILAGVSGCSDDSAVLERLDIRDGRSRTVARISAASESCAFIDQMVFDPDGIVVFSVDADNNDTESTAYIYDVASDTVKRAGKVREWADWDYSPTRNVLVEPSGHGESSRLVERSLPSR